MLPAVESTIRRHSSWDIDGGATGSMVICTSRPASASPTGTVTCRTPSAPTRDFTTIRSIFVLLLSCDYTRGAPHRARQPQETAESGQRHRIANPARHEAGAVAPG